MSQVSPNLETLCESMSSSHDQQHLHLFLSQNSTNNPLCETCRFDSASGEFGHTQKFLWTLHVDLLKSADAGCAFCKFLCRCAKLLIPKPPNGTVHVRPIFGDDGHIYATFGVFKRGWTIPGVFDLFSSGGAFKSISPQPLPTFYSESQSRLECASKLYAECQANHGADCEVAETRFPHRVLDLRNVPEYIRLLEPNPEAKGLYAALSYSWGGKNQFLTKRANLEENKAKIPCTSLPPAFLDATNVAQALNIQYMWIDSLCIIQDDKEDWAIESSKMADIYSHAACTIVAASTENPLLSFLNQKPDYDLATTELHVHHSDSETDVSTIVAQERPGGFHLPISPDVIDRRAWCYQESFLARRIISFTNHEVQYTCPARRSCECGKGFPNYAKRSMNWEKGSKTLEEWFATVEEFTRRNLAFQEDKLPAISGIAKMYRDHRRKERNEKAESVYVAGMWVEQLALCLCWCVNSRAGPGVPLEAPTFSWAATTAPMLYDSSVSLVEEWESWVEVLSFRYNIATMNVFGPASDVKLRVSGPLLEGTVSATVKEGGITTYCMRVFSPTSPEEIVYNQELWAPDVQLCPHSTISTTSAGASKVLRRSAGCPDSSFSPIPVKVLGLGQWHTDLSWKKNTWSVVLAPSVEVEDAFERLGGLGYGEFTKDGKEAKLWKAMKGAARNTITLV